MNLQAKLSRRQAQVAGFLAAGYTKKEVANHLSISERTVENTARNIYEKAEVRSVGQLCAWWFCKTFNIPHQSLPTITFSRMQGIACLLLALIMVSEVLNDSDMVRARTCKVAKAGKAKRGKRRGEEDDTTIEIENA